jgi:hypothetical protein
MRNISPDIFCDEWFGSLDANQKQLWMGLILACADDQGRLINNPPIIRGKIFPYDESITNEFINNSIQEFIKAHKLLSYKFGENNSTREYIQISKWWEYQKGARWAAASKYTAPEKWMDRIKTHMPGSDKLVQVNWDKDGGLCIDKEINSKPDVQRDVQPDVQGDVQPDVQGDVPPIYESESEVKSDIESESDTKPSIPVLIKAPKKKKLVGLVGYKDLTKDLNDSGKETAMISYRVLLSSKMIGKKLDDIVVEMATRIKEKDITNYLMASFASVFDDPAIKNKPIVAAYRVLNHLVPAQYFSPDRWKIIPKEILSAAGILDLNKYISQNNMDAFLGKKS